MFELMIYLLSSNENGEEKREKGAIHFKETLFQN